MTAADRRELMSVAALALKLQARCRALAREQANIRLALTAAGMMEECDGLRRVIADVLAAHPPRNPKPKKKGAKP